ncbi:MAG: hypothetical protein RLP15_08865 [Cryomorphaceae bacterium]
MEHDHKKMDRRTALKASSLVFMGLSFPSLLLANSPSLQFGDLTEMGSIPPHFPNIDPEIVGEVVGKSHFNLERVKELVDPRPELARSVLEWRFGDFESAIGAASHVGRRDIVFYLLEKGARPTLFTFAMLGAYEVVKAAVESTPGIQRTSGPHGISLLDHAYAGERMQDEMSTAERDNLKRTKEYLETLGDASGPTFMEVSQEEQKKYLGDYQYGSEKTEGFSIQLNMREMMSLGPIGGFGGALYRIGDQTFTYNGAPSVKVTFDVQNDVVQSLRLTEPGLSVVARKIS